MRTWPARSRAALVAVPLLFAACAPPAPLSPEELGARVAQLRDPLDPAGAECAVRILGRRREGREALRAILADPRESEDARRRALRGLDDGTEESFSEQLDGWRGQARDGARRSRREAAYRLGAFDDPRAQVALGALGSDPFDDVRAAALAALVRRGAPVDLQARPDGNSSDLLRRLWAWYASEPEDLRTADSALRAELVARYVVAGFPRTLGRDELAELPRATGAFDRVEALGRLVDGPLPPPGRGDVLALLAEEERRGRPDPLGRAAVLRAYHAGRAAPLPLESLRDREPVAIAWLVPGLPWGVEPSAGWQWIDTCLPAELRELGYATFLPVWLSRRELAPGEIDALLTRFADEPSVAIRRTILRAALSRSRSLGERLALRALEDHEPTLRLEAFLALVAEPGFHETLVQAAESETSRLAQVRMAPALGNALSPAAASALFARWARSSSADHRRLALHGLASRTDTTAEDLASARILWSSTPVGEGERAQVFALLAHWPEAEAELLQGLDEVRDADSREVHERVEDLASGRAGDGLLPRLATSDGMSIAVRAEAAVVMARAGEPRGIPFLREHYEEFSDELRFRVLEALGHHPSVESWDFLRELGERDELDPDQVLEFAAPMCVLPEVGEFLETLLQHEADPLVRQAVLRGLGRAGTGGAVRIGEYLERADPRALPAGDLLAAAEALPPDPTFAALLVRVVLARLSAGVSTPNGRLRSELARSLSYLHRIGPGEFSVPGIEPGDLILAFGLIASSYTDPEVVGKASTADLLTLLDAIRGEFPAAAALLADRILRSAEPEARIAWSAHRALAERLLVAGEISAAAEHARAAACAWHELEVEGRLDARDQARIGTLDSSHPALRWSATAALLEAAAGDLHLPAGAAAWRDALDAALRACFSDFELRELLRGLHSSAPALFQGVEEFALRRFAEIAPLPEGESVSADRALEGFSASALHALLSR